MSPEVSNFLTTNEKKEPKTIYMGIFKEVCKFLDGGLKKCKKGFNSPNSNFG